MRSAALASAILVLIAAPPLQAQQDRATLIEQARLSSDEAARWDLFTAAASPAEPDSLWAVAVYELAQIMRDQGEDDVAATWIRFALRQGQWEIDRAYFAPSLVAFYDSVAAEMSTAAPVGAGAVVTEWEWPDAFAGGADGALAVNAAARNEASVTVTVEGQQPLQAGSLMDLAPGTYALTASADGYEPVSVAREILPGVRTRLLFELAPLLADGTMERIAPSVVRLRASATSVCRNGMAVRDGLVVTTLGALGGAETVEVLAAGSPPLAAEIVQMDAERDLAVLSAEGSLGSALDTAPLGGQAFGWALFHDGCGEQLSVVRERLGEGGQPDGLPASAAGGPLVDRTGAWLGLVGQGGRVSPVGDVEAILDEATMQLDEGGFPTFWVLSGAAVLGGAVAAVLLLGDDPAQTPSTGSITITIPGS